MEEKYTVLDEIKNNVDNKEKLAEVIFEICTVFRQFSQDSELKAKKEMEEKNLSFNEYCEFRKNIELNIVKN